MSETLAGRVRDAAARLAERGAPDQNPALDAEVLARHVLGWDRARWIGDSRDAPSPEFDRRFDELIERRLTGEPVAYLTGTREFRGLDFEVTPAVLIPRPETELLVEEALKLFPVEFSRSERQPGKLNREEISVADVGTGSGCVAVALAVERPGLRVIATDISERALDVARRNAARHGVADRIDFRLTPVLDGVGEVDVVVSNPPYVAVGDAPGMMTDVRDFEPHAALFSGTDGLAVIRSLLADVARRDPSPPLVFEFGGNEAAVRDAVAASGLHLDEIVRDLAGIPRIAIVGRIRR